MSGLLAIAALALTQPCQAIDGDTIRCIGGNVRFEAIDTADGTRSPVCRTARSRSRHWCDRRMADAATAELRHWLARGPYVLVLTGKCDFYQRHLGTVRRGPEDARDVLLAMGLARRETARFSDRRCG